MKKAPSVLLIVLIVALSLAASSQAQSQGQSMISQYRQAYKKERENDLQGAIQGYQEIIATANANRRHVAEAHYRLGMCYLKTEGKDKAIEEFQLLISDFSQDFPPDFPKDMSPVERAKQQLKSLGTETSPKESTENAKEKKPKGPPESMQKELERSMEDMFRDIGKDFGKKYPPQQTVKLRILGVTDKSTEKAIIEQLKKMIDSKDRSISWSGSREVLNVRLAPVRNVKALAEKIQFGTVTSIDKNSIVVSLLGEELSHDDGLTTNNKYFAADGCAVKFEVPKPRYVLTAVRIWGVRLPNDPKPAERDFHIVVCDENSKVISEFPFPYTRFQLNEPSWVKLDVKPTEVPAKFIIYLVGKRSIRVNCDAQGSGNSFTGLPGSKMTACNYDWMIRAVVKPPKARPRGPEILFQDNFDKPGASTGIGQWFVTASEKEAWYIERGKLIGHSDTTASRSVAFDDRPKGDVEVLADVSFKGPLRYVTFRIDYLVDVDETPAKTYRGYLRLEPNSLELTTKKLEERRLQNLDSNTRDFSPLDEGQSFVLKFSRMGTKFLGQLQADQVHSVSLDIPQLPADALLRSVDIYAGCYGGTVTFDNVRITRPNHDWMIRAVVEPPGPAVKEEPSKDTKTDKPSPTLTNVNGRIRGTDVVLTNASFESGQLAIYSGDGWAFNPSVLVFLFTEEGVIPEDRSFSVAPEAKAGFKTPHVHYRWQSGASEQLKTEVVMDGYRLNLKFGQVANGRIPGQILFEIPGKDTRIEGHFVAEIVDKEFLRSGGLEKGAKVLIPKLKEVRIVDRFGRREAELLLSVELPQKAADVTRGKLDKAVTTGGKDVIKRDMFADKIRSIKLGKDKQSCKFTVSLPLSDEQETVLKELRGWLEYVTATESKEVDLGVIGFKKGAKGQELGVIIKSIWEHGGYSLVGLNVDVPEYAVKAARFYGEYGQELEIERRGTSVEAGEVSINYATKGKFPTRGRIVLEVLENPVKHKASFRATNVSLKEKESTPAMEPRRSAGHELSHDDGQTGREKEVQIPLLQCLR